MEAQDVKIGMKVKLSDAVFAMLKKHSPKIENCFIVKKESMGTYCLECTTVAEKAITKIAYPPHNFEPYEETKEDIAYGDLVTFQGVFYYVEEVLNDSIRVAQVEGIIKRWLKTSDVKKVYLGPNWGKEKKEAEGISELPTASVSGFFIPMGRKNPLAPKEEIKWQ